MRIVDPVPEVRGDFADEPTPAVSAKAVLGILAGSAAGRAVEEITAPLVGALIVWPLVWLCWWWLASSHGAPAPGGLDALLAVVLVRLVVGAR
jgi:hypothetical protein